MLNLYTKLFTVIMKYGNYLLENLEFRKLFIRKLRTNIN